jgi:hypothetical protein
MVLKNIDIHVGYLVSAITAFGIAYSTAQGTIQDYIHFADPLNEMAFCVAALFMGVICLPMAFSKSSNNSQSK